MRSSILSAVTDLEGRGLIDSRGGHLFLARVRNLESSACRKLSRKAQKQRKESDVRRSVRTAERRRERDDWA